MVGRMAREGRHLDGKPFGWEPREDHLTVFDREEILVGLARGDTLTVIARSLGRAVSTISREVKRGGGREEYSAWRAHEDAREQARRPKPFKLDGGRLLETVTAQLKQLWSPQEIAARLRLEHPDDPEMHVSHETIYQSLFVQGRGQLPPRTHPLPEIGTHGQEGANGNGSARPSARDGHDQRAPR